MPRTCPRSSTWTWPTPSAPSPFLGANPRPFEALPAVTDPFVDPTCKAPNGDPRSYRGSYQPQPPSYYYQEDRSSYEGHQWQQPQYSTPLEMVEQAPSPLASPPLHLQGEPRTAHFQDVGRGHHWRTTPSARLFLVTKSTGGDRVVINLSSLNLRITCPTFKMQTVAKVRNFVPSGALFTSTEISDAFHHVPIHPRFQKYLAFTHEGKLFFFQAMPIRINIGPRIFSMVVTEALKLLHKQGIPASLHIDDWLLWDMSHTTLTENTSKTVNLLTKLGFTLNLEKSQLIPTPTITYLGITWSGTPHTLLPSSKSLDNVISLAQESLQVPMLTRKQYQRLLGSINFITPCISQGLLHLQQIILTAPEFKTHPSHKSSHSFLHHLQWWTRRENLEAPIPMSIPPPHLTVWTDASKTGWGVSSFNTTASGLWTQDEALLHINSLECLAITRSLQAHSPPRDSVILIRSDNTVVVSLINKQGTNKSRTLSQLLQDLLSLSLQTPLLDRQSLSPARAPQRMGGLTVTQPSDKSGVVPLSAQLPAADSPTPQASDRPLHSPRECETSNLWLPLPVPNSNGSGCLGSRVEPVGENLALSPSRPHPNLPPEARTLRRHGPHRCPLPSFSTLVARVPRGLHPARRRPRCGTVGTRRVAAGTRNNILSLSRLEFLQRISLQHCGSYPFSVWTQLEGLPGMAHSTPWQAHHKSYDPLLPYSPGSLEGTHPQDYPSLQELPQTPTALWLLYQYLRQGIFLINP